MFTKIATATLFTSSLTSYLYLQQHPLQPNHPALSQLFRLLRNYNESFTMPVFKILMKMRILKSEPLFKQYVLGHGFDVQARWVREIEQLGFKGVEIGPISAQASQEGQLVSHLGAKSAIANLIGYCEKYKAQNREFELRLNLVPNSEVIKITPYLIKENLVDPFLTINQVETRRKKSQPIVDQVKICFDHPQIKLQGRNQPQVIKMMEQTKKEINEVIAKTNQGLSKPIAVLYEQQRKDVLSWSEVLSFIINEKSL